MRHLCQFSLLVYSLTFFVCFELVCLLYRSVIRNSITFVPCGTDVCFCSLQNSDTWRLVRELKVGKRKRTIREDWRLNCVPCHLQLSRVLKGYQDCVSGPVWSGQWNYWTNFVFSEFDPIILNETLSIYCSWTKARDWNQCTYPQVLSGCRKLR